MGVVGDADLCGPAVSLTILTSLREKNTAQAMRRNMPYLLEPGRRKGNVDEGDGQELGVIKLVYANLFETIGNILARRDEGNEEAKAGAEGDGVSDLEETEVLSLLGESGARYMLAREVASKLLTTYWTSPWMLLRLTVVALMLYDVFVLKVLGA